MALKPRDPQGDCAVSSRLAVPSYGAMALKRWFLLFLLVCNILAVPSYGAMALKH